MKLVFGQTGSNIATVQVTLDAGSSVEYDKWTPGIAHLAEHMVFQGSTKMSHKELMCTMARLGVSWNAYTSHSRVCFFINAPHENIEEATKHFSDMILHRKITQESLDKERLVVLEEERGSQDDVDSKIYESLNAFLCEGPLSMPILGSRDSISSITLDEINRFFDHYYKPSRMLVTITSPNPDHQRLGELFGKPTRFKYSSKAPNVYRKQRRKVLEVEGIQQSRVFITYRAFPIGHKDALNIQFLEHFLSRGMDSRLFETLRQKHGLCYSAGSMLYSTNDVGWLIFWTETAPEHIDKAVRLIGKEIKNLLADGPTTEEMDRAKNKFLSSFYEKIETSYGLNSILSYRALNKLPKVDVSVNRIKHMTKKKVMDSAENLFQKGNRQVFICKPEEK